ncbi:DUF402 domain-containing protein [Sporosarcina sp. D27]|uniref:DUF402 domain-containing protein n=1 Tax=Sporosarcina sp. D27 TaxID=1382305 RepID=UPI0004B70AA0|nr:DUF402 domain-containing protein [Sporosarcina sp. D27]
MEDIIERKIKYNTEIVDYKCKLLELKGRNLKLFHVIETPFTMIAGNVGLTIPKGSYTVAYFWEDRPYNLYFWRNSDGEYLGAYFNIVKNTIISSDMVSFEDLILDILVFPDGEYYILDEDELPVSIDIFEEGYVKSSLNMLTSTLFVILEEIKSEAVSKYNHKSLSAYLF